MKYSLIKKLYQAQGLGVDELASRVGMSRTGLSAAFKNDTLRVETLEKIAEVLGVSPCYFFEGEKQKEQEAKFEYLKNDVLGNGGISFDMYNYFEKSFLSKLKISEEFMELLDEHFADVEQKEILERNKSHDKIKFEDYIQGDNVWLLSIIRDAVVGKGIEQLREAFLNEIKDSYKKLVASAMVDERIKFLLTEELIGSKELLLLLTNRISITLELIIDTPVIKFLEEYFSTSDIYEALGYLMPKRT